MNQASVALLSAWLLVGWLVACGGAPPRESPPDLPAIEAAWSELTYQLPVNAEVAFFGSLDVTARAELSRILGLLEAVSDLPARLGDALGIDLASPEAFDHLGLRPDGGLALGMERGYWLGLVDLADARALREVLQRFQERNPDLPTSWRRTDGQEVLSVSLPDASGEVERLHLMVTRDQLLVLFDSHDEVSRESADAYLARHRHPVAANVRFNSHFIRAVTDLGGSSWGLFLAETPTLLEALTPAPPSDGPTREPSAASASLGGGPGAARCRTVTLRMGAAVPVLDGIIEREVLAERSHTRERQRIRMHVAPTHAPWANQLLRSPHLDDAALVEETLMGGYLRLDRDALIAHLAQFADAAACPGAASLAGQLGRLGVLLRDDPGLGQQLDGLVAAAVFDLRNAGGVPFADVFVGLGSAEPVVLSQSLQQILEAELALRGSPQQVSGISTISYRFALLYRLTLLEGEHLLGLTLGMVNDRWLGRVLRSAAESAGGFARLRIDGEAMQEVFDMLVEVAMSGVDDEDLAQSQRQVVERSLGDLRRLRLLDLTAGYAEGVVDIDFEQVTAD